MAARKHIVPHNVDDVSNGVCLHNSPVVRYVDTRESTISAGSDDYFSNWREFYDHMELLQFETTRFQIFKDISYAVGIWVNHYSVKNGLGHDANNWIVYAEIAATMMYLPKRLRRDVAEKSAARLIKRGIMVFDRTGRPVLMAIREEPEYINFNYFDSTVENGCMYPIINGKKFFHHRTIR